MVMHVPSILVSLQFDRDVMQAGITAKAGTAAYNVDQSSSHIIASPSHEAKVGFALGPANDGTMTHPANVVPSA
jgi:hypothetical protein